MRHRCSTIGFSPLMLEQKHEGALKRWLFALISLYFGKYRASGFERVACMFLADTSS